MAPDILKAANPAISLAYLARMSHSHDMVILRRVTENLIDRFTIGFDLRQLSGLDFDADVLCEALSNVNRLGCSVAPERRNGFRDGVTDYIAHKPSFFEEKHLQALKDSPCYHIRCGAGLHPLAPRNALIMLAMDDRYGMVGLDRAKVATLSHGEVETTLQSEHPDVRRIVSQHYDIDPRTGLYKYDPVPFNHGKVNLSAGPAQ